MAQHVICGHPMADGKTGEPTFCGRGKGHEGKYRHQSVAAVKRMHANGAASRKTAAGRDYRRAQVAKWREDHPARQTEIARKYTRKRREDESNARYIDMTAIDDVCYLCGKPSSDFHVEHVIPVSRFKEYAEGREDFVSAVRLACAECNLSKGAKDPAAYVLERLRAGLPLRRS